MKTIKVSDADYETLMGLSRELQLQPNHGQAFPYYWEPRSDHREYNLNGEGEYQIVVLDSEEYDPVELAEEDPELFGEFLAGEGILESYQGWSGSMKVTIREELRCEWVSWLCCNKNYTLYTYDMEPKRDHNPSLFLDDVKGYIEHNQHHLGPNAHTYANTVWRMPRMEQLVGALYRINPQPEEDVCSGAITSWIGTAEKGGGQEDGPGGGRFKKWWKAGKDEQGGRLTIFDIVMYGPRGSLAGSIAALLYLWYTS